MSIRARLLLLTASGLGLMLAFWGWSQMKALSRILTEQDAEILNDVGHSVGEYYSNFSTDKGLEVLDRSMEELLKQDASLARIDLFSVYPQSARNLFGVSRIKTEWGEDRLLAVARTGDSRLYEIQTDAGPALGLLYPLHERSVSGKAVVGVMVLTLDDAKILASARRLLVFSSIGLLLALFAVVVFSANIVIQRPLRTIIRAMDAVTPEGKPLRVPLKRRDEWGLLARSYNRMADEIEQAMERNAELNRGLEARVQEATAGAVQLQTRLSHLERLSALGFLTARLAHDMGTPLHSIAGMTQLLLEQGEWSPEVRRKLELISEQARRLDEVLQNVRRSTRMPEPHFAMVPLDRVLDDTLPLVAPSLERAGIRLEIRKSPDPHAVYLAVYRVQTALFNLIQNAVEAMPGGGVLTLTTAVAPQRREVVLEVEDTGEGIHPEVRQRIFEPIFSTKESTGVKGLGLSIVEDIMKMHGGRIEVNSVPGRGTRIGLYFPFSEGVSPESVPPAGA